MKNYFVQNRFNAFHIKKVILELEHKKIEQLYEFSCLNSEHTLKLM